jgi:hypothetical protein
LISFCFPVTIDEEAKRSAHQEVETRKTSLEHDLTDLSWTNNATDYTRVN